MDQEKPNTLDANGMIYLAHPIKPTSWLNEDRFKWFKAGYDYASSQTRAIPALAKITPEELYFAVVCVVRGAVKSDAPLPDMFDCLKQK